MNEEVQIRKMIKTILNELFDVKFNSHKYNSFSELTEKDLYDIAKWGLMGDYSSSGCWDGANGIGEAAKNAIDGFKNLLNDEFPDGFKNIPDIVKIYRFVVLKSPDDLNKEKFGYSWFTNPDRIESPDFKQQMLHLKTAGLYLITAQTPQSNIDIPRSLFQRDMVWIENEVVLKTDTKDKVKLMYLRKIY